MDTTLQSIIEIALQQGIWAALYIYLFFRMLFMAEPEKGRSKSIYFNGYGGKWCHRFADWLAMNAGMSKEMIPNTSNCGKGIW